jgi:hypothetical protein
MEKIIVYDEKDKFKSTLSTAARLNFSIDATSYFE